MRVNQFLNQRNKWPLLVSGLTRAACHSLSSSQPSQEKIFRRGRKLVYQVARQAPASQQVRFDTLTITCLGKFESDRNDTPAKFKADTTQRRLGWSCGATSTPNSFSGVLENDSLLWSHPPRDGDYAILELSPYPYVKLPATAGQQWQWRLGVGSQWRDKRWATWQGETLVVSNYRTVGQRILASSFGPLTCWLVQAKAVCPQGSSTLEAWYHPTYGFVCLRYRTIDGGHLTLTLVKAYDNVLQAEAYLPRSLQLMPH